MKFRNYLFFKNWTIFKHEWNTVVTDIDIYSDEDGEQKTYSAEHDYFALYFHMWPRINWKRLKYDGCYYRIISFLFFSISFGQQGSWYAVEN